MEGIVNNIGNGMGLDGWDMELGFWDGWVDRMGDFRFWWVGREGGYEGGHAQLSQLMIFP